jgi:hypothetical protein
VRACHHMYDRSLEQAVKGETSRNFINKRNIFDHPLRSQPRKIF